MAHSDSFMPTTLKPEFKYEQWAGQLRSKIGRGELVPGDRLPSHSEMKAQFGLSRPTVERIHTLLENEGLIVREARRGAFVAAPEKPASNIIGIFSPLTARYKHQPYNMHLLAGVREVTERMDRPIMLLGGSALQAGRNQDWRQLGGFLALASDDHHITQLLDSLPPRLPCVTLIGETPRALSIICDDYHGAMAATEHLLKLGHRRIAALFSPIALVTRRRIEGYRQALREAGIDFQEKWLREQSHRLTAKIGFEQAAKQTMQQWLHDDWSTLGYTAIVAQNDESAIGIIEALREAGVRVPQDVSVVGFDGTELARHYRPQLTTMRVPLHEIGARGAQLLIDQMDAPQTGRWNDATKAHETLTLPAQLQIGGTTSAPQ